MIYKDCDELLKGYLAFLESRSTPIQQDDPEATRFSQLMHIYHHAICNPPEGVIGVGAITYAEHKLVEAQQ
jgi:hypothetical protein